MSELSEHGLDDVMAALRDRASSVRGSFDAGALAAAGRRRARRRRAALGGALAGVMVVVLGGGVWGLTTWADQSPQVAADPSDPVPAPTHQIPPVEVTVDTSGWPTYSSPQYPVTFQYPPDWTVGDLEGEPQLLDGCDTINCVLFVVPPQSSDAAPVELVRNGFAGSITAGSVVTFPSEVEVLGSVPGLSGWALDGQDQDGPGQVVVVSSEDEWGVNYSLTVAGSAANGLAFGAQNPLPDGPQTAFLFSTNVGNIGGESGGEYTQTLVAILASVQPNPGFAPTRPEDDGTG
ncbi:MAG: hypothetical protein FWH11_09950 [Micrococcales bacterium]|nr:hypothetical protein [Micrococcales bacterium]